LRILSYSNKIIEKICKNLKIGENQQNNILSLFLMIVKDKSLTKILFKRHIDYIILSCIYSICKNSVAKEKDINLQILLQDLLKR